MVGVIIAVPLAIVFGLLRSLFTQRGVALSIAWAGDLIWGTNNRRSVLFVFLILVIWVGFLFQNTTPEPGIIGCNEISQATSGTRKLLEAIGVDDTFRQNWDRYLHNEDVAGERQQLREKKRQDADTLKQKCEDRIKDGDLSRAVKSSEQFVWRSPASH